MNINTDANDILIVDDNIANLEVLSEALTQAGFQTSVAIDGENALEQIPYHKPELILLDIMMPGIDGFETCRRLKENPDTRDIPVIFMTALSDSEHKVKGLSSGAVDYITKPFQQEEVLARVRLHLKLRNLSRTLKSQNSLLKKEIENGEQMAAKLLESNTLLEQRVATRTEELSNTLQNLQQAQSKLIQQEKLSALGKLVAGVAHEINNPVNFIHGNITYAVGYVSDLLKLVQTYQKCYPQPAQEVCEMLEDMEIDFLSEDLPKLIQSMEVGTKRIREIVLNLRIFSRLDEAAIKEVDLHAGIDSTLMILNSRLKGIESIPEINVVKEYGDLPKIRCYPGQLNQVFMNILSNAIDALEENAKVAVESGWKPEILLQTKRSGPNEISVHLIDNGPGIPVALQEKIFDPFFTTKPVGKGTGLGLSISHDIIVEKHHGRISAALADPEGTHFTITVPVDHPELVDS